jgi:hypothetical protein
MKHTPGLWHIIENKNENEETRPFSIWDNNLTFIARVIKEYPSVKAEANARLIAAAPELLEACKAMLEWQRVFFKLDFDLERKLREAIEKAEGRE